MDFRPIELRRILQRAHRKHHININCVDSLGRGALTLSIDGENLEMVELLIIMGVETNDALLQAINAEFVEAVELLLEHEELIHKDGDLYVSTDRQTDRQAPKQSDRQSIKGQMQVKRFASCTLVNPLHENGFRLFPIP